MMAAEVVVFDGLNVAPRVSPHRKTTLRITDLFEMADERRLRTGLSRHQKGAYYSPRHRHNFDQVRFTLEGSVKYGPLQTQAGDAVYFPEGVFYGPTEIVSEEALTLTIQTQGPSWGFFPDRPLLEQTTAELAQEAELDRENGRIRWPSGRWQDSYEAAWERITGTKMEYPPGRFQTPVLLRSSAFAWVPILDAPGVCVKPLARFNETGPNIRMIRVESSGLLPGGESEVHQIATIVSGAARYGEREVGRGTILYYPPGSTYAPLSADEPCELLTVQVASRSAAVLSAAVA
jgi:mannose-6-phosphate isomerase-like protein (cupin superfamily)